MRGEYIPQSQTFTNASLSSEGHTTNTNQSTSSQNNQFNMSNIANMLFNPTAFQQSNSSSSQNQNN